MKDLCSENLESPRKGIQANTRRWKRSRFLMDCKNWYCKNCHCTKANLQAQAIPVKIPRTIVRDRKKILKIFQKTQKTKESEIHLR